MKEIKNIPTKYRTLTALIIFILVLTAVVSTQKDIGITWDEIYINDDAAKIYVEWSKLAINGILSGDFTFTSKEVIDSFFEAISDGGRINWHPPFARILGGISRKLLTSFIGEMQAYRMPSAIFFSLEAALLFLIVSRFFGISSGILSSMSFVLIPRVFAHAHIFALDTPVSAMWFITIYSFIRGLENKRWAIATGFLFGLALSTKIHAALIPVAAATWYILTRDSRIWRNALSMSLLSIPVFILSWPWLWYDTFSRMSGFENDQIGNLSTNFKITYYLGNSLSSAMPWHYVTVLLLTTLPPLILIAFFYGSAVTIKNNINILNNNGAENVNGWNIALLLLANAGIMLAAASAPGVPKYDGVRLFLPAFTFISAIAGIGAQYFISFYLKKRWQKSVIFMLYLLLPLLYLIQIHPYELSYYNLFAGGIKGANKIGLETTYWGDTLNNNFIDVLEKRYGGNKVLYCGLPQKSRQLIFYNRNGMADKMLVDNAYSTDDAFAFGNNYDYLVLNSRQGVFRKLEWFYYNFLPPQYSANIDGVKLISIYESLGHFTSEMERKFGTYAPVRISFIRNNGRNIIKEINTQTTALLNETKLPEKYEIMRISTIFKATEAGKYKIYILAGGKINFFIDDTLIKPEKNLNGTDLFSIDLNRGFHLINTEIKNPESPRFIICLETPSGISGYINPEYLFPL